MRILVASALAVVAAFVACTDYDTAEPTTPDAGLDAASTTPDATTGQVDATASDPDTSVPPKTCTAKQTLCGDECIADLATSASHCGRCDHSCGPGTCAAGQCQPFPVVTGLTNPHVIATSSAGLLIADDKDIHLCSKPEGCTAPGSLLPFTQGVALLVDVTVGANRVYFAGSVGDLSVVWRCPLAGCPAAGPDVVESIANDTVGRVVAGPSSVFWSRASSYYGPYSTRCALPDCGALASVRPKGSTQYSAQLDRELIQPAQTVSVGELSVLYATNGLYNSSAKQLRACASTVGCATPTEVPTSPGKLVAALTYFDGQHYGANTNSIFGVNDSAPGAGSTERITDVDGIADVGVDASGIYWVNGATGHVAHCAKLTGCTSTAVETLAVGQTSAFQIRLDDKFVYWMTKASVMKVAKP